MAYRLQLKSRVVLRDGQSVNQDAPRSYRVRSKSPDQPAAKLVRVIWPSGRFAYRVSEDVGYAMHRERIGQGVFTRKHKLVCVKLREGQDALKDGTRYVTQSASEDNIKNVFAFIPILHHDRSIFSRVVSECYRSA